MIRLSFLKVLVSPSIAVEIYMIMYICTRTYAYTVYIHICMYCIQCDVSVFVYILNLCMIFENGINK